jgi:antitoxin (DNA-binding transcriptional repressor) of toxin-antitoxin stability system
MTTITAHEAKTHLSRYLAEVELGKEYVIARGKKAVAKLVPVMTAKPKPRPKVGETLDVPFPIPDSAFAPANAPKPKKQTPRPKVGDIEGKPFVFPDSAFAPLTPQELKEWGL